MTPLDRKLIRDLCRIKGQATAIALVVALGVMMLVMMDGLVLSLEQTRDSYYQRYRLATVFAPARRVPDRVLAQLQAINGVAAVSSRVAGSALIDLADVSLPLSARAISLPGDHPPLLNDLYLVSGRRLNPDRDNEIILLQDFARAHSLGLGASLKATINGNRRVFKIVGLAQAPEFIYSAPPGEFIPDDARFAVFWLNRKAMAAAFDMEGAFNEALFSLTRDARLPHVLKQIDNILEPYGGLGSYDLSDHISNRFVNDEINGLKASRRAIPPLFLAVAAFLLNIVISRMIQAQREQIGLLKAFGYTDTEIGGHYFKFILVIALGGALLGCLLGVLAGHSLTGVYQAIYKFPFLLFRVDPLTFVTGTLVSVLAASAGGALVLRTVFRLTPAAAMSPPAPVDFSRSLKFTGCWGRWLDQPSRMVIRRLLRQPGRLLGSVVGIAAGMALSCAMLTVIGAFNHSVGISFNVIDRSDVLVSFTNPLPDRVLYNLGRLKGVLAVEPARTIAVVLRNGRNSYRGAITGLEQGSRLYRAIDVHNNAIPMKQGGVILGSALAKELAIKPGQLLTVEVREGHRPVLEIPVAGVAETLIGSPAYMNINSLNRALKETGRVSGAWLHIDKRFQSGIYQALKDMPEVQGVSVKSQARVAFEQLLDASAGAVRYIMTAIAGIITFGIVYNSARIAFAEQARDIASLRVLGFTRAEAAFVLLGELAIITLLAIPLGGVMGYYLSFAVSQGFSTDLYRIPTLFVPESYGMAALAVVVAALASGAVIKRDLDRINLVAALKIRE